MPASAKYKKDMRKAKIKQYYTRIEKLKEKIDALASEISDDLYEFEGQLEDREREPTEAQQAKLETLQEAVDAIEYGDLDNAMSALESQI